MDERGSYMKLFNNLRKRIGQNTLNNNKGQGATEYILLLVVIVGLVVMFGPKIKSAISGKTDKLAQDMEDVKG